MATEVERLIVALEARTKAFETALKRSNAVANKQAKSIETRFAKMNKSVTASFSNFGNLGSGLGKLGLGLGTAAAAREVQKYADAWTVAGNKLAAASTISGRQGRSLSDLNKIATETRSGLTETVDLYAKLLRSTADVAKSEQEVATATEVVNKAFKAGGAAASEQAAGVLQLSQALGSGFLQGDELRSIRENAPLIARAIANEFKTTIGGLKQLGADGELSVERVFKAILNAKPEIDRAYGSTTSTIADGFTLLGNAVTEAVGKLNESTGASKAVIDILGNLAKAVGEVAGAFDGVKDSKIGKFVAEVNELYAGLIAIGPAIGKITGLDQIGASIGATEEQRALRNTRSAIEETTAAVDEATTALEKFFDRFERVGSELLAGGAISKGQYDAISRLRQQLRDGAIDADGARKAVASIADSSPYLERLSSIFNPLIDNLKRVVNEAKRASTAVAAVAGVQFNDDERQSFLKTRQGDKAYVAFRDERDADAKRLDTEKAIDTRTDVILKAAKEIGVAMTEAAARIQAAKEIAAEEVAKSTSASISNATELIKEFEGFSSKAYPDYTMRGGKRVNSGYRAGFGSDTIHLADGTIQKITSGMSVSVADANRDLVRRIGEFQDGIKGKIGADTFNGFDEKQQAALTSIAYNYGSLPQRIVDAIKTGNQTTIVQAIRGLGGDNGGINRNRRNTEADIFLGGSPSGVKTEVKSQDKLNERLDDTRLQIELLNKQAEALGLVNPLVNDYGYALTKAEIAQKLLNDAQDAGVEITPELRAKIDELAEGYARATVQIGKTEEAQGKLQTSMSESTAFGKDVLGGFISDLREGKSATEALAGALDKVADKLLEIGLNALFDGIGGKAGGGGGLLGGLFSFLFAKDGGVYAGGKKQPMKTFARGGVSRSAAIFGEAGPEAAVPLPDGRRIPVDLRGPSIGAKGGGSNDVVRVVLTDDSGRMAEVADQRIKTHSGTIVDVAVQKSQRATKRNMSGYIADAQSRRL